MTTAQKPVVAMLLYPGLTHLDLIGPHATWGLHMDIHLAWKTLDPVETDTGMRIVPTTTLDDCPVEVDILFVPGGFSTLDLLEDTEVIEFLRTRAVNARYITSVCSGSLLLGAAGLLEGYRAGIHWALREFLAPFSAECVIDRVVTDRSRITGGGVTAGIDFGLVVLEEMLGEQQARIVQLMLEYDPAPPRDAGTPEKADAATLAAVAEMLAQDGEKAQRAVEAAARKRLPSPA